MLEKEVKQAAKIAEKANKQIEELRRKLDAESEKSCARAKRELTAARKSHTAANNRLKKARASLLKKASLDGPSEDVQLLLSQVQALAEAAAGVTKTAYDAAERYMSLKADILLEQRKAGAANRAAILVEKALQKIGKKPAGDENKAAPKKRAAAKKRSATSKRAPAKKKAANEPVPA
jgi:colicin import membrane protein